MTASTLTWRRNMARREGFARACRSAWRCAAILEVAEAARDDIATLVGLLVVPNTFLAIGFGGDDRLGPMLL